MVADSKRLGFPFLAGSSLPVTWRLPSIDMPYDAPLVESVCVGYGGVDAYDFHGLETAQCMSDRPARGGETGVESVHAVRGPRLWEMLAGRDREVTRRLMVAALCCSHNLPVSGGYPTDPVTFDWARRAPRHAGLFHSASRRLPHDVVPHPHPRLQLRQGLRRDNGEIVACQMYLPMPTQSATTADFFNPLTRHIETMVLENREPVSGPAHAAHLGDGDRRASTPCSPAKFASPRPIWQFATAVQKNRSSAAKEPRTQSAVQIQDRGLDGEVKSRLIRAVRLFTARDQSATLSTAHTRPAPRTECCPTDPRDRRNPARGWPRPFCPGRA